MTSASPTSTGPAGPEFEGEVAAHYLLTMLVGGEPRGLPGTLIDKITLQRSGEGFPLDDVIVHAHEFNGAKAILEVQVKRSATFAPQDEVFASVVRQIVEASKKPEFWNGRHELGIAVGVISRQISGAYQDTLSWARSIGNGTSFFATLDRQGTGNKDMRTFADTFRTRVSEAGGLTDNEDVWRLLRRCQILPFDFTAYGSVLEALSKERASRALHPDDAMKVGAFWSTLVRLAIARAATGGEYDRTTLEEALRQEGFRLADDRRHSQARSILAEDARHALAGISNEIGGVTLARSERVAQVHKALDAGRYVEIRGDAGVGKSGILKSVAEQAAVEGRIIVLSPGRTTPGGFPNLRAAIGFDGTARTFLTDLAGC